MQAALISRYGNHDVFEIGQVPTPHPNTHQVLIKVHASGINLIDCKTRKGNLKFILGSHFPIILGYDVAGEIVDKGKNVRDYTIGDRVYTRLTNRYGKALAEYTVADEKILDHIPDELSYLEAAAFPLASLTALQALRDKARIQQGHRVLITGATGGVGHFAVQIARLYGAHVTAYCGPGHEQMLQWLGPDEIVRYNETPLKQLNNAYDIIFDAAGKTSFLECEGILKRNGVYVAILPRPKLLVHKIIACFRRKKVKTLVMRSGKRDMEWLSDQVKNGKLKVHIDRRFLLQDIVRAHEYVEKGHSEGKVVVEVHNALNP